MEGLKDQRKKRERERERELERELEREREKERKRVTMMNHVSCKLLYLLFFSIALGCTISLSTW